MSFPRYPKYKDSGVEWLGEVPVHWEPIRYKNVFREKAFNSGAHLPAGSISFGRVVFKDDEAMNEATKATYQEVLNGEFLINPINLNYDLKSLRTALSEIDTCVSPAYIVLQAKTNLDRNYMKHQLSVFNVRHMKTLGAGVRQTISFSDIGACFTQLPTLAEQAAIAEFLDRETGKIDELVAEQRRLMELLKEKRQAVISNAVTRGLNPTAPRKPSGVEWIGEVPSHWRVVPIKHLCKIESGHTPQKSKEDFWVPEDCKIPWISLNDTKMLAAEDFIDDTVVKISELGMDNSSAHLIEAGAVVMNRDGARVGLSAITTKPMCVSQHLIAWVCGESVYNYFLLHVLYAMNDEIYRIAGGTTIPTIGMPDIREMKMPLPPLKEQKSIVEHLLRQRGQIDALNAEAQRAIELLQERRTALISAAVTGQIDVRNFSYA